MPDVPPRITSPGTSRSTSATIAPNILHYLVRVTDACGVDLQPLLNRVGLDPTVMGSAELRVSYRQGSDVIRQAVELTGDEHLGLRVGAAQHLTAWGLLGFAMMAADTQEEAIETGVRYQNLSGAMTVWSAGWEDVGYVLRADLPDPALDPTVAVFLIEEAFSSVVTLTRLSIGASFAPQAVEFAFPAPRDTRPFDELFRCPLRFDAAGNRMVIPARWARAAMPGRDPITYTSVLDVLEKDMTSRREQQDVLEVLEISIAQSLPDIPSFIEQARKHASSERTLRRRLAECGTTYEAIVDGVRRERVEQLLRRPELTLRDIARQAGFADVSALRRAVRRWHGVTPLELRAGLLLREAPTSRPRA
ncbi:AraC family transcriptional regulator [Streptomyces cyaneochromogenes]|uniref:AraC family transcriptional regulator n=1 Tax=Streptomyces cyaneochromogenes TaxID=2496836 RepID=A0A3Q9ET03_9ACTN|nr:AraC family transcriptional regulator [Streptomyces cyaneochromogenes]AZQ38565.1 AraC family transcriptional regulator [Streptomyces cyaneochromogenes]